MAVVRPALFDPIPIGSGRDTHKRSLVGWPKDHVYVYPPDWERCIVHSGGMLRYVGDRLTPTWLGWIGAVCVDHDAHPDWPQLYWLTLHDDGKYYVTATPSGDDMNRLVGVLWRLWLTLRRVGIPDAQVS